MGSWRSGDVETPLALRAQGFNRHTFLCGQSGSGKTYALGVILEQLIMHTELPIVVLDPNGDYVHLGTPRPDAPPAESAAIRAADIVVRHGRADGEEAIKVAFVHMPRHVQAAVLELDPVRDREEYNQWLHLQLTSGVGTMDDVTTALRNGPPAPRALGQRIENLGVAEWDIWPWNLDHQEPPPHRVTVLDVSTFRTAQEPLVTALDVVERLWANREDRVPTLVVIDEAHNLCPAAPTTPLQTILTDRLIQIAAEGRKYGIWLLLSTQRPSKVHPQVTSQCDNLVLMRMNSPADVEELGRLFGFVPPSMLEVSPTFAQGELLVAGVFTPVPIEGRVGPRITVEGGSDVRVPMPPAPDGH
ncbi:ATPase [Intrasporangium oryzae NRRL B-24470]|uniref:ATPase n=1 Tax=Intrasporangium oryzae NRRL B-24470 TaxID=1386089 RepID=W9GBX4_9MICO|nr:ATPase [Intrasporangium oryzae NRRL B-24470]